MIAAADAPIVVGVGDSPLSLTAVRLAAQLAASQHRPLIVAHAFELSTATAKPSGPPPRELAEKLIDRAANVARQTAPELSVEWELVEGSAVATLIRHSETAALVAIGPGHLADYAYTPQEPPALQVAARAASSVLVVREKAPPQGPVLVGVDGSDLSYAALDFAFSIAAGRRTQLLVVRVNESENTTSDAARELDEAITRRRASYPDVEVRHRVLIGDPTQVLVEQSRDATLVVVGSRGEESWRGLLGQVSQALLYHSPVPVLVVRGPLPESLHIDTDTSDRNEDLDAHDQ